MPAFPPPCIHGDGTNLCPACAAEYEEDADGYLSFGEHPAGQENWRRLCAEIAAEVRELGARITDDDGEDLLLPF